MQKRRDFTKRAIASLIVFMLVCTNFATLGNALVVYAANENADAINFSAQFVMIENSDETPAEDSSQPNEQTTSPENSTENLPEETQEESLDVTDENQIDEPQTEAEVQNTTIGSIVDSLNEYNATQTTEVQEGEPDVSIPGGEGEPDISIPGGEGEPDVSIPSGEDEPDVSIPSGEDEPDVSIPENNQPKEQILQNGLAIEITVGVKDTGYLKNARIDIKDLPNQIFTLEENISLGEYIQSIEDNKIKLKQINNGTEVKVYIPIKLKNEEYVNIKKLQEGVELVLTTTYVNNEGSEEILTKTVKPVLDIQNNLNLVVGSNIEKFIPYKKDGVNEALVQLRITIGTDTANELPIKDTTTRVTIPGIEGAEIKDVTVAAISTGYTNGLTNGEVIFTAENWSYQDGAVTIGIDNVEKDGMYKRNNGNDEYIISYKYTNIGDISNEKISSDVEVKSNVFTSSGTTEISNQISKEYDLSQANSNIITYDVTRKTEGISKGYLYANANGENAEYELEYDNAVDINISREELVKVIEVRESDEYFVDGEGNRYTAEGNTYYKSIKVNRENLMSIIGENGNLELLLENGTSLIRIDKTTADEGDGNITISFGENKIGKILIRINNPEAEGILDIVSTKVMEKTTYSKMDIMEFVGIQSDFIAAAELKEEGIITELDGKTIYTELTNTTTDASVSISRTDLSTLVKNEDLEIEISLNNATQVSDMYKNPVFELTLPREIKEVEIKDVNLLYGNGELEIGNIETLRNNEDNIVLKITLNGAQTKYALGESDKGTTVIIKTDMKVDMYTASRNTKIEMNYYNEDATNYGLGTDWKMITEPSAYMLTGRQGTYETELNIVAPEGLVNAQMITGYKEDATIISINQGLKEDSIATFKEARQAEMKMIVINNTEEDMKDVAILGRTIFNGNKSIVADEALGTNFDAPMISGIKVGTSESVAMIYYSENGEATKDLEKPDNGWKQEVEDVSKIKSYLIVLSDEVKSGNILSYSYNFEIPENLSNNIDLVGTFATYCTVANEEKVIEADRVVLTTGDAPLLSAEMTTDVKGSVVLEGQYINYTVTITNDGRTAAENVVFKADIPEGTIYVNDGELSEEVTDLAIEIGDVKAYHTETIQFQLMVKEGFEGSFALQGVVEADGLETPIILNKEEFNIDDSQIGIEFSTDRKKHELLPDKEMTYTIEITNKESETINNIVVKQILPEQVDFVDAYISSNSTELEKGIYDEQTRTITWNIDSLNKVKNLKAVVKGKDIEEYETTLVTSATIESENLKAIYNTGDLYTKLARPELKVDSYTTSENRYIKEGDYIEYIVNVENVGKTLAEKINVSNELSDGLVMVSGECELSNGRKINGFIADTFSMNISLLAGESAKIKLKCRVADLEANNEKIATTSWKVSGNTVNSVETPRIENILQPLPKQSAASETNTGAFNIQTETLNNSGNVGSSANTSVNVNNVQNVVQEAQKTETKYRIIGRAFYDLNQNGQRDDNEEGMENIVAKLCDVSSQAIVAQTVTSASGEYIFDDVDVGEYYVKFDYDSSKYQVTDYKKDGVTPDRNSDAIVSNYKAVTDKISVTDSSISDIDVGLYRAGIFDLSLDVNINKLTVQNEEETNTYDMENSKLAKVDIDPKQVTSSKIFVEYTIDISNKGEIAGYAKSIMSYLPNELELDTSLNTNWYVGVDGNAHTRELEEILIQPGETKTITLILTKQMTDDGTGLINNIFEIEDTFNEYAVDDIDSTPANNADGEDDMSSADVIIGIKTGGSMINVMIITTTLITLLVVLYVIKLRSDNKNKEVII